VRVDRTKASDINHLLCIVCTVRGEGEKASRRNSSRLQFQSLYVSAVQTKKSTKTMNSAQNGVNKPLNVIIGQLTKLMKEFTTIEIFIVKEGKFNTRKRSKGIHLV
jgi:hypothetical protein